MLKALSEKHSSFFRPLKKKGFKEERVTTIGLYDIGKSHDPGIQQEPLWKAAKALFDPEDPKVTQWVGDTIEQLLQGPASAIARSLRLNETLQGLSAKHREPMEQCATS